jgi:hypothetical protein
VADLAPKARLKQEGHKGMAVLNSVIYVDESGNLTDPNDPFVVVAALVAEQHDVKLKRIISKERRRLRMAKGKQKKERKVTEFKFRSIGDRTKQRILERLGEQKVELFLFILEKGNTVIADTPKNYARLVWPLLAECLKRYPKAPVIIDSHFDLVERREAFDAFIAEKAGRPVAITHVDSNLDAGVGLADFVAGAVLYRCRLGDSQFEEIFKEKVIWEGSGKWKNKW